MTKKIKISTAIISIAIIILGTLLSLILIKKSYYMSINVPDRIVVYYDSNSNNIVLEKNDKNYNRIYSQLIKSYKQPILSALFNNSINKDVKLVEDINGKVEYKGIIITFIYDSPQAVKLNKKVYDYNGEVYWFQNLVFTISNANKYQYNSVAIIPPENSINYISPYNYTLSYSAYSNFYKLNKMSIALFK